MRGIVFGKAKAETTSGSSRAVLDVKTAGSAAQLSVVREYFSRCLLLAGGSHWR